MLGDSSSAALSRVVRRPTDVEFLDLFAELDLDHIVTVPSATTDTWHALALEADRASRLRVTTTTNAANLPGIAAGHWFGSGRPAVIHLENSGLGHLADGVIGFASPEVYGIPMLALVTWRGIGCDTDSEPLLAVGRRTGELCASIFGQPNVNGRPDGGGLLMATRRSWRSVLAGSPSAVLVPEGAFLRTADMGSILPHDPYPVQSLVELRLSKGVDSFPGGVRAELAASPDGRLRRDDAIQAIVAAHPNAAILFAGGYTARAAQAVADRPGNFYNAGYMGGTLAVGWGLATERPGLEVVVVDGDQHAAMSAMPRHLVADYPSNLTWYVLDNEIGASAGVAPTPPAHGLYDNLCRVIPTTPDLPGSFVHPRVSTTGVYAAYVAGQAEHSLAGLARGFRRWLDDCPCG